MKKKFGALLVLATGALVALTGCGAPKEPEDNIWEALDEIKEAELDYKTLSVQVDDKILVINEERTFNDFLEMLVDYGVIGLLLYILIIISFISEMMYSRRRGLLSMFQLSLISLSSFIIMSLISHLFLYPTFIAYLMIAFGIAAGMNKYTKASLR